MAQTELEDAKFVVSVDTQTSDEPKNQVLTQDPLGDTEAEEGSTVNLVVSAGPEQVVVPNVEGLTEEAARQALIDADLVYAGSNDVPSDQPAGIVVGSDPAQGTTQDAGTEVTLDVSNGEVRVPEVVGDTEASARSQLSSAGFPDITVVYEETDSAPPGTVLDQSVTGFARIGTPIVLTVAEAPPEPTQTETASPSPSDTTTNNGNGQGDPP